MGRRRNPGEARGWWSWAVCRRVGGDRTEAGPGPVRLGGPPGGGQAHASLRPRVAQSTGPSEGHADVLGFWNRQYLEKEGSPGLGREAGPNCKALLVLGEARSHSAQPAHQRSSLRLHNPECDVS